MNPARAILPAALLLGACGAEQARPVVRLAPPIPVPQAPPAAAFTGGMLGRDARGLVSIFGQPNADIQEGMGRKLQFAGPVCVLDAYLYPPQQGRGEATVRHVDARQRNGGPIDEASCVAALTKRGAQ